MPVTGRLVPAPMDPNTDIKNTIVEEPTANIQAAIFHPRLHKGRAGKYNN